MIGGVADVDSDGDMGIDVEGGGDCAANADFFLGGGDGYEFGLQLGFLFCETAEGFGDGEAADFVVEGASGCTAVAQNFKAVIVDDRVADGNGILGFFFVLGPDIDPEFVEERNFFPFFFGHEVDGAFSCDAGDWAFSGEDFYASSGDDA